jgi:hypothetical protein
MYHYSRLVDPQITYYAFENFSNYRKYSSLEESLLSKPIYVFKELFGYWKNAGYKNRGYHYEIFNSTGEEVKQIVAPWQGDPYKLWVLMGPDVRMDNYFQATEINFQVTDPRGEQAFNRFFGHGLLGIANAMNYLGSARRSYSMQVHEMTLYSEMLSLKNINLQPLS